MITMKFYLFVVAIISLMVTYSVTILENLWPRERDPKGLAFLFIPTHYNLGFMAFYGE